MWHLNIALDEVQIANYTQTTFERHQSVILDHLGFRKFAQEIRDLLEKEAAELIKKQLRPRSLFMSLVDFLRSKKLEVPSYHALAEIITDTIKTSERELHTQLENHLTVEQKSLLDHLLEQDVDEESNDQSRWYKWYKLTLLKKSHQSTRPSKIRDNIDDLKCLEELFDGLEHPIQALNLTPELIQFYARIVVRSQAMQLIRRDQRKYLYLITFVIHQYYHLNDLLVDTILQVVRTSSNTVSREHRLVLVLMESILQLAQKQTETFNFGT